MKYSYKLSLSFFIATLSVVFQPFPLIPVEPGCDVCPVRLSDCAAQVAETEIAPASKIGLRGFFSRHPKLKKVAKGAAFSAALGTGVGVVTGAGMAAGAAAGAGRGAAFGAVRTTKTWEKGKEKLVHHHKEHVHMDSEKAHSY